MLNTLGYDTNIGTLIESFILKKCKKINKNYPYIIHLTIQFSFQNFGYYSLLYFYKIIL